MTLLAFLKRLSPFHFDLSHSNPDIAAPIQRGMQYSVWEGALTGIMAVFTGGVVLTGFALALGASDFVIGLIAALQAGANLLQMSSYRAFEKSGKRKERAVGFAFATRFVWLPIGAVAFLQVEPLAEYRIYLFLALFALAGILAVYSTVPWLSWHVDLVPQSVRGRFFAQRNLAAGAVGVVLGVLAGRFIDLWKAHAVAPERYGFAILIFIGTGFGLLAVRFINKMHHPPYTPSSREISFWQSLKAPFRDTSFRQLFYFRIFNDISLGMAGPFLGVYMLKQVGLSFTFVSVMAMIATLTNLFSLKLWGRMIDKFGSKPILYICLVGKSLFIFLWIFTAAETTWLFVALHLFGVFDAGNAVAIPNLLFKIAPEKKRANYIAVDGTAVGVAATISPLIGGGLALLYTNWSLTLGPFHWEHLHFLFATSALFRIANLGSLRRVHEPAVRARALLLRVLRPIRSIDVFEGFQQALHATIIPSAKYFITHVVRRSKRAGNNGEAARLGENHERRKQKPTRESSLT